MPHEIHKHLLLKKFFLCINFNKLLLNPTKPIACVKKIAAVFLFIFFSIKCSSNAKFFRLISTKTGLKPAFITEIISEFHVNAGTIISFLFFFLFISLKIFRDNRFADAPEFTKVQYLTPSHFDHFSQIL